MKAEKNRPEQSFGKRMVIAGIGTFSLFVGILVYENSKKVEPRAEIQGSFEKLIATHSVKLGPDSAKVKITEFLDPECPSCARVNPVLKRISENFGNDVQISIRYLLFHKNSKLAVLAIESARSQGKFWEMLDILFTRSEWTHQKTSQEARFEAYAAELGLDVSKFKMDLGNSLVMRNIQTDADAAKAMGVKESPVVFVNERSIGNIDYDTLRERILAALAEK